MERPAKRACSATGCYFFQITRRPATEISPRAMAATHLGYNSMFCRMDTLVQAFRGVIVQHWHSLLADDRSGIHAGIHEMHRATRHANPMRERLFPCLQSGKRRQQRRMDIDDAIFERAQKIALKDTHESREDDQVHLRLAQSIHKSRSASSPSLVRKLPGWNELCGDVPFTRVRQDSRAFNVAEDDGDLRWDFAGSHGIGDGDKI